jgi:hypothetical protein
MGLFVQVVETYVLSYTEIGKMEKLQKDNDIEMANINDLK